MMERKQQLSSIPFNMMIWQQPKATDVWTLATVQWFQLSRCASLWAKIPWRVMESSDTISCCVGCVDTGRDTNEYSIEKIAKWKQYIHQLLVSTHSQERE